MKPKLIFLSGDREGLVQELGEKPLSIGRHPREDLVLSEDVVSRRQATIYFENGDFILRDVESTNGTFVNDRKVKEQVLRDGDVIEFGLDGPSARFVVEAPDPVGATRIVSTEDGEGIDRVGPAREGITPTQELRCLRCEQTFAVPATEVSSAKSTFVLIDEALPALCPVCGDSLDRARIAEMVP